MQFGRHRAAMSSNIFEEKRYIRSFYTLDFYRQIYTGFPGYKSTRNTTGFYGHIRISLACPDRGWWANGCMGRIA